MKSVVGVLALLGSAMALPAAYLPAEPTPGVRNTPHDYYPHIIGGREVSPAGKYEFLVALLASGQGSAYDNQFCGGALVAGKHVVTAAHCCEGAGKSVYVCVGCHDLKTNDGEKVQVKNIKIHPEYNKFSMDSDVCVLELNSIVSDQEFATLDDGSHSSEVGKLATVAGWGNTKASGIPNYPNKAQEVDVPLVSEDDCNAREAYNGDITGTMLCAGYAQGGKDSCQGDSGGPLFTDGNVLIGVVSWGEGCAQANKYGVYARVSELDDWVVSVINGSDE